MKIKYQLLLGFLFIMILFGAVSYGILTINKDATLSYIETSESFRKDVSAAVEVSSYAKRAEGHLNLYWIFGNDIDREKFYERHRSLEEQIAILEAVVTSMDNLEKIRRLKAESQKIMQFGEHVMKSYIKDPEGFRPAEHEAHLLGLHNAASLVRKIGVEITQLESMVMFARIEKTKKQISSLQHILTIAILVTAIIATVFSIIFASSISRPIMNIRDAAAEISNGNLDKQAVISNSRELGELASSFNEMVNELKISRAEAIYSGQLASLGELAAGVAHEINNPINGVINYAQLLADAEPSGSKEKDRANKIVKEGNRVAEIVRSLLSYARQKKDDKNPVILSDLLTSTLHLTMQQSSKDAIRIETDVSVNLPQVMVHPQQIQQVMLNLISNAKYALNQKYPDEHVNKKMEIRGEEVSIDGKLFLRISFLDYGTGISSENIQKAINPFYTSKPPGEGTGLGLSISNSIINNHNGSLKIESVEGDFTLVTIDLPATETHG